MTRSVYFYQNQTDFADFINYLQSLGVTVYSYCGEPVDFSAFRYDTAQSSWLFILESPSAVVQKNRCCVHDRDSFIQISTPYQTGVFLQWGSVILNAEQSDSALVELFGSVKKYIRTQYTISDSKQYYAAPGICADWMSGRVEFPDLFKRKELNVTAEQISLERLAAFLSSQGYLVKENGKDIREPDGGQLSGDAWIVCRPDSVLKTAVLNRKQTYLPGSECIFLWRTVQKGVVKYSFQSDLRLPLEWQELWLIVKEYIYAKGKMMELKTWIENQLSGELPEHLIAFNFNLYETEEEDQFDAQLIGCREYDTEDEDWACSPEYSSGEDLYHFFANGWEEALEWFVQAVREYLQSCRTPNQLTAAEYVTAGFVDGDLEVIAENKSDWGQKVKKGMKFQCCMCGKSIGDAAKGFRLHVKTLKPDGSASQELYVHADCLENSLFDRDSLYIHHLD